MTFIRTFGFLLLVVSVVMIAGCKPDYIKQTEKFAARVKSTVNPDELQSWATNLIATMPVSSLNQFGDIGTTNLPSDVRGIYKDDPPEEVQIHNCDTGPYVQIIYGSGFGHWGLYVGFTNLVMQGDERFYVVPWKPGIYFWNGP